MQYYHQWPFNQHVLLCNYKHRDNWRHQVAQLFDGGECLIMGIVASNKHEKVDKFVYGCTQEGIHLNHFVLSGCN